MMSESNKTQYWQANLKVVATLLSIWFLVGYGLSIFFIEQMNSIQIGQLGFGFWMAQQGAIFVFVVLVVIYAVVMDRLDRKYNVSD